MKEWELSFNKTTNGWECVIGLEVRCIKDCGRTKTAALKNTMLQLSHIGLASFTEWANANGIKLPE